MNILCLMGCSKNDEEPIPSLHAGLQGNKIIINDIQGIPETVEFDHVEVEINGKWWAIIGTVKGDYDGNSIILELPEYINPQLLSPSQWVNDENGYTGLGYWPVESIPSTGVAGLGDFIAYNGTNKVGRIYLSDWKGRGSTAGKAFIYYHYAEKAFSLSGDNKLITYKANFKTGWNAYANIKTHKEEDEINSNIRFTEDCTTNIPEELELQWRFESWAY